MGIYMTNTTLMRWAAIGLTVLALLLTMAGVLLAGTPTAGGGGCSCLPDDEPTSADQPDLKQAEATYREALDQAGVTYKETVRDARAAYREALQRIEADDREAIDAELARLKALPAPRVEPEPKPEAESEADAMTERTVTVELDAPSPLWSIQIRAVRQVGDELWVLSDLNQRDGMGAMVITTVSDERTVEADDDLPVKHFVTGKTWNWENEGEMTFIDDADQMPDSWADGRVLAGADDE